MVRPLVDPHFQPLALTKSPAIITIINKYPNIALALIIDPTPFQT
jgi:hypothetical protein